MKIVEGYWIINFHGSLKSHKKGMNIFHGQLVFQH